MKAFDRSTFVRGVDEFCSVFLLSINKQKCSLWGDEQGDLERLSHSWRFLSLRM